MKKRSCFEGCYPPCPFAELSPKETAFWEVLIKPVSFAPGQVLFEQGARHSGCYLLCDGLVRLYVLRTNGVKLVVGLLGPGDIAGISCFLGQERHELNAEALTEVWGCYLSRAACQQVLEKPSELGRRLIPLLAQQIRWTRRQLGLVAAGAGVRERLAALLIELGRRCGTTLPSERRRIELKLSCELLGEMIDSRRQGVNTKLKELERRGLIARNSGQIIILDEAGLREVAQSALAS